MLLRSFTRNLLRNTRPINESRYVDFAVCIDIECTCDTPVQIHPMEIIEIACLKIDLTTSESNKKSKPNPDVFHSFVRPTVNPELTLFCQDLTGITQRVVDSSETIDKVIPNLLLWLEEQNLVENLTSREKFSFASCGNFDMNLLTPIIRDCLQRETRQLPDYFRHWINVKKVFLNHKKEWPKTLYHMLELLDETPEGRPHSAIDDCKNLGKVIRSLHKDKCKFSPTNRI